MVGLLERDIGSEGLVGDDHARGVGGGVPGHPLQLLGRLDQIPNVRLLGVVVEHPQLFGTLQGLVDIRAEGDQLGRSVHLARRQVQGPAGIADGGAGSHRPEGDDLRDVVLAVPLYHVLDHLGPPVLREVQIDVGHRDPPWVQEALEDQAVGKGVQIGDAQGVRDDGPGRRAAARTHQDPSALGESDKIPHDQKVGGEAHPLDQIELVVQPALDLVGDLRVAPADPFLAEGAEIACRGVPFWHRERRQMQARELQIELAPLSDGEGVPQGLRHLGEYLGHLLGAPHVVPRAIQPHPVRVVHQSVGLDAEQEIMGARVLGPDVMDIGGCDQRDLQFTCKLYQRRLNRAQILGLVVLQFQVIATRPEDLLVPGRRLAGAFDVPV